MAKKNNNQNGDKLTIAPPNMQMRIFKVRGSSAYVQNKFSARKQEQIADDQKKGSQKAKEKGKKKEARDFERDFQEAIHRSEEGWCGIPATAFRAAMISACRVAQFEMTRAKLSVFVMEDGIDETDGTPLVRITKGEPEMIMSHVRNASGVVDLRARPMWKPGWEAIIRVRYDGDQFSEEDVANLLLRAGVQVGVGEGRPDSKKSLCGQGWGLFEFADR